MPNTSPVDSIATRQILDTLDSFISNSLEPAVATMDALNQFPRALFQEFAGLGLLQLWVPESLGGLGPSFELTLAIVERLARSSPAFATGIANCSDCLSPMLTGGSEALHHAILPRFMSGDCVPAFCLSEPASGSDVAAMTTSARAERGGYVLRGRKCWITNAAAADIFVVFAKTDPNAGHRGISAFVIPKDAPGLSVAAPDDLLSLRGSPVSEVTFDDVWVSADGRLGREGDGFELAMKSLDAARLQIAAICLGAAARCIETAIRFVSERRSFGQPLSQHQGIQFKIADLATGLAEKRALFTTAVGILQDGSDVHRTRIYSSMTKLACSDFSMTAASEAVQLLGAQGLTSAYPVARMFRDCKALQILEGANEIQRWVIGRTALRRPELVAGDAFGFMT